MPDELPEACPNIADLPPVGAVARDIAAAWARDALWAAIADLYERYREEQGLTYAALGRRIGRSRSQVQRWLSAPMNMNLTSAGLLVEALDADLKVSVEPRCDVGIWSNMACPADMALAFVLSTDFAPRFPTNPAPLKHERTAISATTFVWTPGTPADVDG